MSLIHDHRENAEIYTDPLICKKKSLELLEEINMPRGILPLEDIVEVGRNHESGFVWLKQKETSHCFEKIKKTVVYAAEVTAFVENRRLKNVTGVKTKELAFWVNIVDISIKNSTYNKIIFAIPSGIKRSFPISAFELEEEEEKKEEKKEEANKEDEEEEDKEEGEEKEEKKKEERNKEDGEKKEEVNKEEDEEKKEENKEETNKEDKEEEEGNKEEKKEEGNKEDQEKEEEKEK